jgi:hypothetical protein
MINFLLNPLNLIVPVREPIISCLINDFFHVLSCLDLAHLEDESALQVLDGFLQKARQSRVVHLLNDCDDVLVIFSGN